MLVFFYDELTTFRNKNYRFICNVKKGFIRNTNGAHMQNFIQIPKKVQLVQIGQTHPPLSLNFIKFHQTSLKIIVFHRASKVSIP